MPRSNVISGFMCRVCTSSLLLRTERWMSLGRGVLDFCLVSYGPFEGMDQAVDACFSSCRYVDCVVSSVRQCLYDSRCDISGIDEVPYLISIAIDGMDDCRKMMPVKGQAEHSTMPAMNQSLPVRLMRNLAARADLFIFLSGIHGMMDHPRVAGLVRIPSYFQNLNVFFRPSHFWSLSLRFSGVPSSS